MIYRTGWKVAVVVLALALLFGGRSLAQPGAPGLGWWTADGGGGTSAGGRFALSGTVGQPDAGVSQGGPYSLAGGFWGQAAPPQGEPGHRLSLPALFR